MLKKTLLATSISGVLASADAAVNLDNNTFVTMASELAGSTSISISDSSSPGALEINVVTGINAAVDDKVYIRFDLSNASFKEAVNANDLIYDADGDFANSADQANNADGSNFNVAVLFGGGVNDDFVVFSASDGDNELENTAGFVFDNVSGDMELNVEDPQNPVTVRYRVWGGIDGGVEAGNSIGAPPKDSGEKTYISFASGKSGDIDLTNNTTLQADVATAVKTWVTTSGGAQSETLANLGAIDLNTTGVNSSVLNLTSGATQGSDLYDTAQALSLSGNFSFGNWHIDSGSDCGTLRTNLTIDSSNNSATAAAADFTGGAFYLCVSVDRETQIPEVTTPYTITALTDNLTATLGTISYNSATIEVDYLTTFADYDQRLYIINTGVFEAPYSTEFVSESGTVCEGITESSVNDADGIVPAGEMLELKVTNIVTISGEEEHCSARIIIDGLPENIRGSSLMSSESATDVVYLNVF